MGEKVRDWHVYVVCSPVPDIHEVCLFHISNDIFHQSLLESHDFAGNTEIFSVCVTHYGRDGRSGVGWDGEWERLIQADEVILVYG